MKMSSPSLVALGGSDFVFLFKALLLKFSHFGNILDNISPSWELIQTKISSTASPTTNTVLQGHWPRKSQTNLIFSAHFFFVLR